ncbi:MAG: hypothetical protein LBT09_08395, partial [Planctomycetaceae bacterium]|nr:hypothetical protein [Planctomycetaceae bacterium]
MIVSFSLYVKRLFASLPKFYRHDLFCRDIFLTLFMARLILSYILDKELLAELDLSMMEIVNDKFVT